jgi:ribosomal-protein-alanine N-acetyltransferase
MPIVLETDRLQLRQFTLDDAEAFYQLCSNPLVTRFTGDGGVTSIEQARASLSAHPIADYYKHGFGRLACVFKANGLVIGFAGLKYLDDLREVDIGYRFLPDYWGIGLATEAARVALDYGFTQLHLPQIIGLVDPANAASVRVLEKLGLTNMGTVEYRGTPAARYVIDAPLLEK